MEYAGKLFAMFRRLHSQRDHGAVFCFTLGPSGADAVPAAAAY